MACNNCGHDEKNKEQSFAVEMLRETSKNAKRWFIAFLVVLICWLATIGGFLIYLNQYDFASYSVEGTQDGQGINIIGGGDTSHYGAESKDNR